MKVYIVFERTRGSGSIPCVDKIFMKNDDAIQYLEEVKKEFGLYSTFTIATYEVYK